MRPISKEVADAVVHLNASTYSNGCDQFRFYTNISWIQGLSNHAQCGPPQGLAQGGCVEQAIQGSMDVPMASTGWFTALNTPIFVQAWRHLMQSALYQQHAWIVKLDINVAWRPERMRSYLSLPMFTSTFEGGAKPLWALNDFRPFSWPDEMTGRWHLIGGIEVLSRGSMQLYADKRHVCEDQAEQYPTEDDYIEYCMRGKRDDLSKEARSTTLPLCQPTHCPFFDQHPIADSHLSSAWQPLIQHPWKCRCCCAMAGPTQTNRRANLALLGTRSSHLRATGRGAMSSLASSTLTI